MINFTIFLYLRKRKKMFLDKKIREKPRKYNASRRCFFSFSPINYLYFSVLWR